MRKETIALSPALPLSAPEGRSSTGFATLLERCTPLSLPRRRAMPGSKWRHANSSPEGTAGRQDSEAAADARTSAWKGSSQARAVLFRLLLTLGHLPGQLLLSGQHKAGCLAFLGISWHFFAVEAWTERQHKALTCSWVY